MNKIAIIAFLIICSSGKTQNYPIDLKNNNYIAVIDRLSLCEEIDQESNCEGQELRLLLLFNEKNVIVQKRVVNSCNKVLSKLELRKFRWFWAKNKLWCIIFNKEEAKQTFLEDLIIVLEKGKLIRRKLNKNNYDVIQYQFYKSVKEK